MFTQNVKSGATMDELFCKFSATATNWRKCQIRRRRRQSFFIVRRRHE
jgi:hypothetical protein